MKPLTELRSEPATGIELDEVLKATERLAASPLPQFEDRPYEEHRPPAWADAMESALASREGRQ